MASLPYPRFLHNPPTDSTDFHRWDLYKELPQNSRNSQKLLRRVWHPCHTHAFFIILPQIPRNFTDGTYTKNSHRIHGFSQMGLIQRTPTDSTDFHRWDLYKELPQNSQNSQKFRCIYCSVSMAGMPYHPIHLCKSVESVGVFSISTSVNSVESVGVFSISTSVNSVKSVGVFLYKYFREFREICGSFLYKYFREFRGICGNVLFSSILWER